MGFINRLQLFYILKSNKVETEYQYYLEEGHGLKKFENRKDALDRSILWIDKHLN